MALNSANREDDTNWPKKNIVGKQELEIRVGNDHIAFEVYNVVVAPCSSYSFSLLDRQNRLARRRIG